MDPGKELFRLDPRGLIVRETRVGGQRGPSGLAHALPPPQCLGVVSSFIQCQLSVVQEPMSEGESGDSRTLKTTDPFRSPAPSRVAIGGSALPFVTIGRGHLSTVGR